MAVYKYDEKVCPTCKRAALVRGADGSWSCVPKRSGCGATWPAGTKAIEDQPHTTWRYRKQITLPDGRKVRIAGTPAINTKAAAEKAEREHIERVLNPPKPARPRHKMSEVFDRLLDEYAVNKNNKPSEIESKRSAIDRYLRPELGHLYVDEVTEERLSELTAKISKAKKSNGQPLSPKSVKNILQTLRRSLTWAQQMRWIERAPTFAMPRVDQPEMRFLTDEELAALLEAAASEPKWYAAIVLAADAGLRLGELRALRWSDINEVTHKIVVSRSRWRKDEGSPKSRKSRVVDMSQRLRAALRAIRASSKLRGDYVLSKADGTPYGAEHMRDTILRLARKAGIGEIGWHALRHTFCTRLAMKGAPVTTIKELAGHANIATTMRYMHVVPGSTARAIALLDDDDVLPRPWHGDETNTTDDTEAGVIVQFKKATPTGFEPVLPA